MKNIKPQNKEFLQTSSKTNTKKKKEKRPHLDNHRKTAENQKLRGKSKVVQGGFRGTYYFQKSNNKTDS